MGDAPTRAQNDLGLQIFPEDRIGTTHIPGFFRRDGGGLQSQSRAMNSFARLMNHLILCSTAIFKAEIVVLLLYIQIK